MSPARRLNVRPPVVIFPGYPCAREGEVIARREASEGAHRRRRSGRAVACA